jgi:hypothetical protein
MALLLNGLHICGEVCDGWMDALHCFALLSMPHVINKITSQTVSVYGETAKLTFQKWYRIIKMIWTSFGMATTI